jgi:hypothetical protein
VPLKYNCLTLTSDHLRPTYVLVCIIEMPIPNHDFINSLQGTTISIKLILDLEHAKAEFRSNNNQYCNETRAVS